MRMGNDAVSPIVMEHNSTLYTYETIESATSIAAMVQQVTSLRKQEIALVSIALYFENGEKDSSYPLAQAQASTVYLMNNLRPLVRKTDAVFLLADSRHLSAPGELTDSPRFSPSAAPTLYFLLFGANILGGQIVQCRLWEALLWR